MKIIYNISVLIITSLIYSCSNTGKKNIPEKSQDSFLWLEEIEGHKSMNFVKDENQKTLRVLKEDPHFKNIEKNIRRIALANDRVPWSWPIGNLLYNYWQDEKNIKGLWRRTTYKDYARKNPNWETVLDLDVLSKKEDESWVWKGVHCLPPKYERCLLSLSRGGKDAKVIREFDLKSKTFIQNGFNLPEAKSRVTWIDINTIYFFYFW
jgi:prolyl oligopeptidase